MIARLFLLLRRLNWRKLVREPQAEILRIIAAVLRRLEAVMRRRQASQLPDWINEEITALAVIEPDLLGHLGQLEGFGLTSMPVHTRLGGAYARLVDSVGGGRISHVLLLPWLVHGGADRGALYHLQAWLERIPADQLLVVLTENCPSPWRERIPPGVRVLDFGVLTAQLQLAEQVTVLTRLLIQIAPAVIHNINCHAGWEAYRRHGLALRQVSRLYASVFCDDYSPAGVPVGYARTYLRSCASHLQGLFSDNGVFPRRWADELGIAAGRFTVVRFPYPEPVRAPAELPPGSAPRVLWAGRFSVQKRLDLLVQVAAAMPEVAFDVHGTGASADVEEYLRQLRVLPNVTLHGAFERFVGIVRPDHVAYLFTSGWEGVPTILMDACAAGVPIVAPDVGAIMDLLPASSLVARTDDPQAYCAELRRLMADPILRQARREQQYVALAVGRSWTDFIETLTRVDFYLPMCSADDATASTGTTT